ncbi:MAG: DNA-3-methyladenine glycosylase 2 family protein [Candidatus Nanopelagicales bacterium]
MAVLSADPASPPPGSPRGVHLDQELCYRAVASRDVRFDGQFYTAVRTTGIYCRPSCPALTPRRENVSFLPTAAAAQALGYRACKRCRPAAVPGSPQWNLRGDVVARAVRLVADGEVERSGVPGVAARLGYSTRQLNRLVSAELGTGLLALARSYRAQTAAALLSGTDLTAAEVAWAAGFGSVRQFNETMWKVYAATPSELRSRRAHSLAEPPAGQLNLRLAVRAPMAGPRLLGFLGARALPGIEHWDGSTYRRTLGLPRGPATVAVTATGDHLSAGLRLADPRDLAAAVARLRTVLDADCDSLAVAEVLCRDPQLADLVAEIPGLRSPGAPAPFEAVVRAVAGQQVSVAAARTVVSRLASRYGTAVAQGAGSDPGTARPDKNLTHVFPTPAQLADADPGDMPMPQRRAAALIAVSAAVAAGEIDLGTGADRALARAALLALPGIGPWTVDYLAMRGFSDPDVFLPSDLGVRAGLRNLGMPTGRELAARAAGWRPWRSYAVQYLWQAAARPDHLTKART